MPLSKSTRKGGPQVRRQPSTACRAPTDRLNFHRGPYRAGELGTTAVAEVLDQGGLIEAKKAPSVSDLARRTLWRRTDRKF